MISRCPFAEWVPWKHLDPQGRQAYYKGLNRPAACVLHISQGYISTARQWAAEGHYGASWGFSVGTDGEILQHLERTDGGYHAGIKDTAPTPTWKLWRGHSQNVNHYTDSIERMGFYTDYPYPEAQNAAVKRLCQWLAETGGYPYDRDHFPAHAEIDIVNRVNDFARPADREEIYRYMFEEDDMTPQQQKMLSDVWMALTGGGADILANFNANPGNSLIQLALNTNQRIAEHEVTPHAGDPRHSHTGVVTLT